MKILRLGLGGDHGVLSYAVVRRDGRGNRVEREHRACRLRAVGVCLRRSTRINLQPRNSTAPSPPASSLPRPCGLLSSPPPFNSLAFPSHPLSLSFPPLSLHPCLPSLSPSLPSPSKRQRRTQRGACVSDWAPGREHAPRARQARRLMPRSAPCASSSWPPALRWP
jgi:hypothetical protein